MDDTVSRNLSEVLFETYLRQNGHDDFAYEPEITTTTKRPDYRVRLGDRHAYFEVKEFHAPEPVPRVGSFDPYSRIRSKINEARKQFRGLKREICTIVLANPRDSFVFLSPLFVFGAMLGDAGVSMPYQPETGSLDSSRAAHTFLTGGKMLRYEDRQPIAAQNTTISAICILNRVAIHSRLARIRLEHRKSELGGPLSAEQLQDLFGELSGGQTEEPSRALRVVVCENPYASKPIVGFGCGKYDERFGLCGDRVQRRFIGSSLAALEIEESEAGIERQPLGFF